MFLRTVRALQVPLRASLLVAKPRATLIYPRFNSTVSLESEKIVNKSAVDSVNVEEDVDEWLTAIKNLREEFSSSGNPYSPETSLAPPGETEIDFTTVETTKWEPNEEQLAELAALKGKSIPLPNDEVISYCTNLIMRHGKKARAEKFLARALYIVKLQLRTDPVQVFKDVLERMAPLMMVKSFKDGTAKIQQIPVPLGHKTRLRIAFGWIVTRSSDRKKRDFSVRLAEEIIAAHNGTAKGFEYRSEMHKEAVQQRAYVKMR